jgi:alkanesulfonate monooxygenase SsuD/methylene tetrahydromethanopterin reductase-like flavin-dependent oxidoreductase (luciferase family)
MEEAMRQHVPKVRQKVEERGRDARHHGATPIITFEEARREARRKADELLDQMSKELDEGKFQKHKNA